MGYKNDDPCIKKAYPDERLFVLMARDPAAVDAIIQWIGVSVAMQPAEKLHEALDCAIEMSKRCDEFRKRKEEDEKKAIAAREREEFDRWKKSHDAGNKHLNAIFPDVNFEKGQAIVNERGREVIDFAKDEKSASRRDINFAQRFADYLDTNHAGGARRFARFFEEFLKTLPSQ